MALEESWNFEGLAPEMRDVAREAAHRRGVPVDQWLQSAIAGAAAEDGGGQEESRQLAAALRGIEGRLAALNATVASPSAPTQQLVDALAHLDQRLDRLGNEGRSSTSELDKRIAAVDRALAALSGEDAGPAGTPRADAPRVGPNAASDWTLGLDRAVAEIAQRQSTLDIDAPRSLERQFAALSQRLGAGASSPHATSRQSELKNQLRQLTDELQSWRRSGGFHDALGVLREELGEIGRKFNEAVPRKALQALEAEIRTVIERVDRNRVHGADSPALSGIEQGLAEVREVLRQFAPAESLVAFRDEVRALDRKIDWVAANSDGGGLKQLEASVAELREIASHAASGDALIALAEEVQTLADKIDNFTDPAFKADLLSNLDRRFEALAAELGAPKDGAYKEAAYKEAAYKEGKQPAASTHNLVAIVETLAAKLDHLELGQDTSPALDAIAGQLTRLTERIESADARLDNLDQMERTFSELLSRLDSLQSDAVAAAERAARDAVMQFGQQWSGAEVDSLKQDVDALRQNQAHNDRHVRDTLEVVHDTIERLVDRLAIVETNFRGDDYGQADGAPARSIDPSYAPALVPAHAPIEAPVSETAYHVPSGHGPITALPMERRPIDPTLPADHPLEPGVGRAQRPPMPSAAERIAASEAALGPAKPSSEADAKSNFIAAARRAAQAAANMSPPLQADAEPAKDESGGSPSFMQRITRRRSVMAALAIFVVVGGAHIAFNVAGLSLPRWRPGGAEGGRSAVAVLAPARESAKSTTAFKPPAAVKPPIDAGARPAADPVNTSSALLSPGGAAERGGPRDVAAAPASAAAPVSPDAKATTASVSPLTIASIQLPVGDVTGSVGGAGIGRKPGESATTLPTLAPPAVTPRTGTIPAGLQAAASGGNPAAEYEIAARYAEGRGVPQSHEEAARWFERAAHRDLAPAQYRLGNLYEKGQGVKKDLEQARRFYRAAAEKGNGKAMHNLAVLHAEGVDGKPDFNAAAQWFRKAAQRGIADSQYNLGILYARGLGVETNLAESYKWFALAAQQGDQAAGKKRDEIAARFDQPATAAAAREAVASFAIEPQPEDATSVKAPPGGWDNLAPAAAVGKPKSGSHGPRRLGS